MSVEIERKFLVSGDYRDEVRRTYDISQGYICKSGGRTVRVRIRDNRAFITIKGPSEDGGVSRFEWEKEISVEDARELMPLCVSGVISKKRHLVDFGGHTFEVDEFLGENEGLTVAEVELSDADENFERPEWLGEEVTSDRRYSNAALSEVPFCKWE